MVNESESDNDAVDAPKEGGDRNGERSGEQSGELSRAQRARAERCRQRARALRDARLVRRPADAPVPAPALDSGGGFLLPAEPRAPTAAPAPPAPLPHRAAQPQCLQCARRFPHSYLFDTFDYSVCDACRDDEDAHCLLTRTEAKSEYLLQDCDLDARPPPLRCLRRPNPHRAHAAPMRLYVRAQLEERALLVWGSRAALEAERAARGQRRARASQTAERRRLRALRMDVRSALFARAAPHAHAFGPEAHDAAADVWRRECACGHVETYEKM